MKFDFNFFIFISCLFFTLSLSLQEIKYTNGGYNGLTIAIHSKVPENDLILPNLQDLLTKASKFLHDASNKSFQFDSIDIVLPKTWKSKPNYKPISGSAYGKAHVRLGLTDSAYGDLPYTFQPRECGQPGEYIRLSDVYINELNGKSTERFGDPSKHFIHEWAQYRYGLFEENGIIGDPKYPSFYLVKQPNNETFFYPTACTHGILGSAKYADGSNCKVFAGAKVDPKCQFVVDTSESTSNASIMFLPHLKSTIKFCEARSADPLIRHNQMAPSKHNLMCDYLSTWDVIRMHKDYETRSTKDFKPPVFQIYREDDSILSRFVLVMDISGSMRDGTPPRIQNLNLAATRFVKDLIPNGMELGLIQFDNKVGESDILAHMTKVDNQTRLQMAAKIPSGTRGGTSIGLGLQAALNILKENNGRVKGATVILMTDGADNDPDRHRFENVAAQMTQEGVIIDIIAIAAQADNRLEGIAQRSGGKLFYLRDNDKATNTVFETAFKKSIQDQDDIDIQAVNIRSGQEIQVDTPVSIKISLEKELGKNTKFVIHSKDIDRISLSFKSPDGKSYTDKDYKKDVALKNIQLDLPLAAAGIWEVTFTKTSGSALSATFGVSSQPLNPNNQPIRLTTYFGKLEVRYPATALIYAEVKKSSNPVVSAKVISTVTRPDNSKVEVELFDDGKGSDMVADDGVYTASFTQFTADGRYSVNAKVLSNEKTKMRINTLLNQNLLLSGQPKSAVLMPVLAGTKSKSAFTVDDFIPSTGESEVDDFKTQPVEDFTRESIAGAFKVENYNRAVKILPGKVTDLRIKSIDEEKHIVELEFTSPGDTGFDGNVSLIDLRANSAQEALTKTTTFESSLKINQTMLISGELENVTGRSVSVVKFEIPKKFFEGKTGGKTSVYFALRGIGTKKNDGKISNVESVHIGYVKAPKSFGCVIHPWISFYILTIFSLCIVV